MSSAGSTSSSVGPARKRVSKHSLKADGAAKMDEDGPKRVPLACGNCRTRKTRCDGNSPCSNCVGDPARVCTYVPVTPEENALARAKKQSSRLERAAKKGWDTTVKRSASSSSSVASTSRARPLSTSSTTSNESLKGPPPARPPPLKKRHTFNQDLRLSTGALERGADIPLRSPSLFSSLPLSSTALQFDPSSLLDHGVPSNPQSAPTTPSYMYAMPTSQPWPHNIVPHPPDPSQHFRHHTFAAHPNYYPSASTSAMITPPFTSNSPSISDVWGGPAAAGIAMDSLERQSWQPREEVAATSPRWDLPTPPAEVTSPSTSTSSPFPGDWSRAPVPSRLTRPPFLHSHSLPAVLSSFPITLLPSPQLEEQPYLHVDNSTSSYFSSTTTSTSMDYGLFTQTYHDAQSPHMPSYEEFHRGQMDHQTFEFEDSVPMSQRLSQTSFSGTFAASSFDPASQHRRTSSHSFGVPAHDPQQHIHSTGYSPYDSSSGCRER